MGRINRPYKLYGGWQQMAHGSVGGLVGNPYEHAVFPKEHPTRPTGRKCSIDLLKKGGSLRQMSICFFSMDPNRFFFPTNMSIDLWKAVQPTCGDQ